MSSSSDLETGITQQIIIQKKTKKTKKKSKPAAAVTADHPRNEGDDPHWAYEPPEGAVLLDHTVDAGAFEWDALQDDDDAEVWLIRAPDSVRGHSVPCHTFVHDWVDQSETSPGTRDRPALFITDCPRRGPHEKARPLRCLVHRRRRRRRGRRRRRTPRTLLPAPPEE